MEKITISTILEEFEDIGMVKALKSARDFDSFQYKLLLRLFKEYLISALKQYSESVRLKKKSSSSKKVCPICKTDDLADDNYCLECGEFVPESKTTSEELLEKEIDDNFENFHITRKWLKDFVLQKQKEAIEVERQRICDIIVDEFAELQLYFHDGFGGSRISECQKKIAERTKIIQNAKEKFGIDL